MRFSLDNPISTNAIFLVTASKNVSPTDNPTGGDQRKVTIRTVLRRPPARSSTIRSDPQIKSTTARAETVRTSGNFLLLSF